MQGSRCAALLKLVLVVCVAWIGASCSADDDGESSTERRCTALRDHLVELRLADATGVDHDAHREAMKHALGDSFVESCKGSMTASEVSCALRASDADSAAACVEESNQN